MPHPKTKRSRDSGQGFLLRFIAYSLATNRRSQGENKTMGGFRVVLFCFVISANGLASPGHGSQAPKKVGILLVAFGSSEASAQVSFENIEKQVNSAYPESRSVGRIPRTSSAKSSPIRARTWILRRWPWPRCRMKNLPMWRFNPCTPSLGKNITICVESLKHSTP